LLQSKTGVKVVHIAYKGAGPALVAVIGGDAQLMFGGPGVFLPHLKSGRVRALAVGSLQRIPILPEVPTLNESGLPEMETGSWYGLVAPTGTPAAIIKLIHAATVKVLNMPDTAARLAADGAIVAGNTPAQFAQDIRNEAAMWARVIKEAGIKLD
jgi:tripartite-type tricarboxylate transporter receptor subunit TctC